MFNLTRYIEIGDIILVRGAAKHSKIISNFTRGHFSHACLVVGGSVVIEAIGGNGVQYSNCQRFLVENPRNISVLRPDFGNDENAKKYRGLIFDLSKSFQSLRYSSKGAIISLLKRNETKIVDRYFCSQLVAKIYEEIAFPLFEKGAHNVTPNDFLRCKLLSNITNKSISEVPEYVIKRLEQNSVKIKLLDKGGDSLSLSASLFRKLIDESKPIFQKYNLKGPNSAYDIIDALTDSQNQTISEDLDKDLCTLLDTINFINSIDEDNSYDRDHLNELLEELNKYGKKFAIEELMADRFLLKDIEEKWEDLTNYAEMFSLVCNNMGFQYACKMRDYYHILLNNCIYVGKHIKDREKVLKSFLQ